VKDTLIAELNSRHFTDEELMPFARMLAAGKTVAFPTETVYGLGADATSPAALAAIFKAKGRPSDNPLIVHVAEVEQIRELTAEMTPLAQLLIKHFWPGPLTIILKKSEKVSDMVTAGLDTVALRMPSHPLARRLIALAGVPVAAPSANRSGRPSPTRGTHVITDLMGRVDAIIDGGPCEVGLESTVVDATGTSACYSASRGNHPGNAGGGDPRRGSGSIPPVGGDPPAIICSPFPWNEIHPLCP
jgi:L-threonylcarbamoyladenylate synthase